MPVYFSTPLPGPFHYSKRIRVRRSRRRPARSDRGYKLYIGLGFVALVLTIAAPFVMLPVLTVGSVVAFVVYRRRKTTGSAQS